MNCIAKNTLKGGNVFENDEHKKLAIFDYKGRGSYE